MCIDRLLGSRYFCESKRVISQAADSRPALYPNTRLHMWRPASLASSKHVFSHVAESRPARIKTRVIHTAARKPAEQQMQVFPCGGQPARRPPQRRASRPDCSGSAFTELRPVVRPTSLLCPASQQGRCHRQRSRCYASCDAERLRRCRRS